MGFLIAIESFSPAVQVSKMNIYSPFAPFNEIVDSFPIIKASEWMRRVFAQHIDSRARSYCLHFVKRIYALEFLFLCSLSTSTPARRERKGKKVEEVFIRLPFPHSRHNRTVARANGGNENVMGNGENLFYTPQASLRPELAWVPTWADAVECRVRLMRKVLLMFNV
jgi:hypothetical protein